MSVSGTGKRRFVVIIGVALVLLGVAAVYLARNPATLAMAAARLSPDRSNDRATGLSAATPTTGAGLDVARFAGGGELLRPQYLDRWVFMGASAGLGYKRG